MYDLIIIGAGPAGITASVYAARKKMSFLVITKDIGGQAAWSGDIENYTGYQLITGPELAAKFDEHMRKNKVEVKEGEEVISVSKQSGIAQVKTNKAAYEAKTVVIASGKKSKELGVAGEKEFKNKGLTYCATCDGPLFANKDIAVIGGGNSALDAALQMIKIARRVYLINNAPKLDGDAVMREKVEKNSKVTIFNNSQVSAISGEKFVKAISIKKDGQEETLPVEGIFVEIGLIPNSQIAKDVEKNELGEIKIDCFNQTNIPGIFAAGDVTTVAEKQVIVACGEGAKAALGAFRYLNQEK
jgi:alkyl hydroperoxide reductase subunit F